jgi:cytochrome c553
MEDSVEIKKTIAAVLVAGVAFFITGLLGDNFVAAAADSQRAPPPALRTASQPPTNSAEPPTWAYPIDPPSARPPPDNGEARHLPDSGSAFTLTHVHDLFEAPDWYPADHPPMPNMVAHGHRPGVFACANCHLPNGLGRPESAGLAGLPADYIVAQIGEFRSGMRRSAKMRRPPALMVATAQAMNDADLKAAVEYFSALKPRAWIRVVESNTAPKTRGRGWILMRDESGGTEPIGDRIIEVPENELRAELLDSRSGFVAYVPLGSLAKGEMLATTGGGNTIPCGNCHGTDLKGAGQVPPIAGRSPSYLFRQLYDIQRGTRTGPTTALMKPVVAGLSEGDMVAVVAYVASRAP